MNRYYIAGKEITAILKTKYDSNFKNENKIIHSLLPQLIGQRGPGEIAFNSENDMNTFISKHIKKPISLYVWDTEE